MTTQTNAKPAAQTNAKGNGQSNAKGSAIGKPGNQNQGSAKGAPSQVNVQSNTQEAVKAALAKRPLDISDAINITGSGLGDTARGRKPLFIPVSILCAELPCCLDLPLGRLGKPLKFSDEEMMAKISNKEINLHTGKPYTLSDLQDSKTWHYATDSVCMMGKDWIEKEPEAALQFTKGALTAAYAKIAGDKWADFQDRYGDGEKGDGDGESGEGGDK